MSDEILPFTPQQTKFIQGWQPGYRRVKLGINSVLLHVYMTQLTLAYQDWYPFETEECDLNWHTPHERLVRSVRCELTLHENLLKALEQADTDAPPLNG
ncbi:hypothetical protein ARMSODRAFT_1024956 [Armillaria solidipes]|uniref:Uncharacterized protein n=1 Tax=Armillaria solidipes TaxID=1076256 RepID=A0A2H3AUI6_9AGAR|nr:hypothetical protein ARMSODRAFT_1024956 [Armillaria solidipes]